MTVTTPSVVESEDVPPRHDVRVMAGRPFSYRLPVRDADGPAAAAVVASARAQVRAAVGDRDVLHSFGTDEDPADIEIDDTDPDAVVLVITATSETTGLWASEWPGPRTGTSPPESVAWWDVEVTDADDVTTQITSPGTITVVHQVTR
jgi:hypothetical protein